MAGVQERPGDAPGPPARISDGRTSSSRGMCATSQVSCLLQHGAQRRVLESALGDHYINLPPTNTHLWLFPQHDLGAIAGEEPQLFSHKAVDDLRQMLGEGRSARESWEPCSDWQQDSRPHGAAGESDLHPLPGQRPNRTRAGDEPALPRLPGNRQTWLGLAVQQNANSGENGLLLRRARPRTHWKSTATIGGRPPWATTAARRGRGACLPRGAATRSRDRCVSSATRSRPGKLSRAGRYVCVSLISTSMRGLQQGPPQPL